MANRTITLKTQVVDFFGPSPSNKWGSFKWTAAGVGPGNGTWGIKSAGTGGTQAILHSVGHFKAWTGSNSIFPTCPTQGFSKCQNKRWTGSNQIIAFYSNTDKELGSGNGYDYIFVDHVTNIESAVTNVYTSASVQRTTYVSAVAASTTWS